MGLGYYGKLGFRSLFCDFVLYSLPSFLMPEMVIRGIYGERIDFIFLAHPRQKSEIFESVSFLRFLRRFIPEHILLSMLKICPAYVVARVEWGKNIRGLVISTSVMPDELFMNRDSTVGEISRIVKLLRKLSRKRKIYIGLAAWWPIVTNGGLAFKKILHESDNVVVTNGHSATLLSLYLTIKKLSSLFGKELAKINILIIGVGKMGSAVAEILNGKVNKIGIMDKNPARVEVLVESLSRLDRHSEAIKYIASDVFLNKNLSGLLAEYDIAVCTTSNINYLLPENTVLRDCVILDDSRPEAFPRKIDDESRAVVLEGGLMKFSGLTMDADFGFGKQNNVFGCMAEAIILSSDKKGILKPVLGDIDFDNFNKMMDYCNENGISEGDFMSGKISVSSDAIRKIVRSKGQVKTAG